MSDDWSQVPLGDIARVDRGASWGKAQEVADDSGTPVIRIANVQPAGLDLREVRSVEGIKARDRERALIGLNTLLMVGSNGNPDRIGNVYPPNPLTEGMVLASFLIGIHAQDPVDAQWLYYYLSSPDTQALLTEATAGSTGLKNLSIEWIRNLRVPRPPLPVQRRIVDLMTHLDAHIANLRTEREALASVRTANLRLAMQGELPAATMSDEWADERLSNVCLVRSSKRVLQRDWKQSGVPFYRGREVTSLASTGTVAPDLFIAEEHYLDLKSRSGVPQEGDVLVTAIGTLGNAYLVPDDAPFYFKDASVLWLTPSSTLLGSFLRYWFESSLFASQVVSGNGTTVDTLTISGLSQMCIPVPPLPVQRRIVDLLSDLDVQVFALEAEQDSLALMRSTILSSLLNASVTIPTAYDDLLQGAA